MRTVTAAWPLVLPVKSATSTLSCYWGAATALAAGRPGATALLKRALEVHERYFFDHSQSMPTESYA